MKNRCLSGLLALVWPWVLFINILPVSADNEEDPDERMIEAATMMGMPKSATKPVTAFDFPVDPAEYVLGPGDIIGIDIIGEIYQNYIVVSANLAKMLYNLIRIAFQTFAQSDLFRLRGVERFFFLRAIETKSPRVVISGSVGSLCSVRRIECESQEI